MSETKTKVFLPNLILGDKTPIVGPFTKKPSGNPIEFKIGDHVYWLISPKSEFDEKETAQITNWILKKFPSPKPDK